MYTIVLHSVTKMNVLYFYGRKFTQKKFMEHDLYSKSIILTHIVGYCHTYPCDM